MTTTNSKAFNGIVLFLYFFIQSFICFSLLQSARYDLTGVVFSEEGFNNLYHLIAVLIISYLLFEVAAISICVLRKHRILMSALCYFILCYLLSLVVFYIISYNSILYHQAVSYHSALSFMRFHINPSVVIYLLVSLLLVVYCFHLVLSLKKQLDDSHSGQR